MYIIQILIIVKQDPTKIPSSVTSKPNFLNCKLYKLTYHMCICTAYPDGRESGNTALVKSIHHLSIVYSYVQGWRFHIRYNILIRRGKLGCTMISTLNYFAVCCCCCLPLS